MKKQLAVTMGAMLLALGTFVVPGVAQAQIVAVNVDFNGRRDASPYGATYSGAGAAGGGTLFNGINVDDSSESDQIAVTGTNLLDSTGAATFISFSLSNPVGAGNGGAGSVPTAETALFNDYVFVNGGNNTFSSTTLTITGLAGSTANLFFYNRPDLGNPTITIAGSSQGAYTPFAIYNSTNTVAFYNVPIVNGSISAEVAMSGQVWSGFSVEAASVPEPGSVALVALGATIVFFRLRKSVRAKAA